MTDRKNTPPAYIAKLLHPAAHAAAALAFTALVVPLDKLHVLGALVGGLLPDIIEDKNALDLQHRTIAHSFFAVGVLLLLTYAAAPTDTLWIGLVAGYVSHLLLDLTHGLGIMLWFPVSRSMVTLGALPHAVTIPILAALTFYAHTAHTPAPIVVFALAEKTAIPPTVTPTQTATTTPTATPTATGTPAPTGTPTPDYSVPLAASAYEAKRIEAAHTCLAYGFNNPACVQAKAELQNALYRYCSAALLPLHLCAAPTATFTPTRTPTATKQISITPTFTQPPQATKKSGYTSPLCKTFAIPCPSP